MPPPPPPIPNPILITAPPSSRYAVSHGTLKLVDSSRVDPYDPARNPRAVAISLFYPHPRAPTRTYKTVKTAYAPPKTAALLDAGLVVYYKLPPFVAGAEMQVCAGPSLDDTEGEDVPPLVLFSPGLTFSRHQYNALALHLASRGYAVVTMDHAFETVVVEYPDGSVTMGRPPTHWDPRDAEKHEALLATRVGDARFVLARLGEADVCAGLGVKKLDTGRAVVVGHSFGGATAVAAVMRQSEDEGEGKGEGGRFVAAVNMDGSMYGPLSPTPHPVLLLGRGDPDPRHRGNNESWRRLWDVLGGEGGGMRKEVCVKGSGHLSFCDLPLLVKVAGLKGEGEGVEGMMGTLDGERAVVVVSEVLEGFLRGVVGFGEGKGENGEGWEGLDEVEVTGG